jgi:hypothetical protein
MSKNTYVHIPKNTRVFDLFDETLGSLEMFFGEHKNVIHWRSTVFLVQPSKNNYSDYPNNGLVRYSDHQFVSFSGMVRYWNGPEQNCFFINNGHKNILYNKKILLRTIQKPRLFVRFSNGRRPFCFSHLKTGPNLYPENDQSKTGPSDIRTFTVFNTKDQNKCSVNVFYSRGKLYS